jgi:6-phosphogluconolactonase
MSTAVDKRALRFSAFAVAIALMAAFGIVSLSDVCGAGNSTVAASVQSNQDESPGAARSFVYTITNDNNANAIAAYRRDPQTGELALIGTYPTGGRGTGALVDSQSPLVANAEGTRLYAVNPASNNISVMAIKEDGSLEMIGSPVDSRGVEPASLALNGDLLYVANKGNQATPPNYAGFRIVGDELTRIKKGMRELNIGDDPGQVLFNRTGSVLIGTRINGRAIDSYTVRRNTRKYGRLRDVARIDNQPGPFGAAFNPAFDDHLFVSSVRLPGAASYRVTEDGAVIPINSVGNAPERAACWAVVHPNGQLAWISNTGSGSLSLYTINNNGLIALAGTRSTSAFGRLPFEIALDRSGQFLYVLHVAANNPNIFVLRLTGDTTSAGLADVAAFPIPTNVSPMGLVAVDQR